MPATTSIFLKANRSRPPEIGFEDRSRFKAKTVRDDRINSAYHFVITVRTNPVLVSMFFKIQIAVCSKKTSRKISKITGQAINVGFRNCQRLETDDSVTLSGDYGISAPLFFSSVAAAGLILI